MVIVELLPCPYSAPTPYPEEHALVKGVCALQSPVAAPLPHACAFDMHLRHGPRCHLQYTFSLHTRLRFGTFILAGAKHFTF